MKQNQELYKRSDTSYAEQKDLQARLLTIRKHKEILEQKLAEQQSETRKPEKTTLVKRAARALNLKVGNTVV